MFANDKKLLKFHLLLFTLVVVNSFIIEEISTNYTNLYFLLGLTDLSMIGSIVEFRSWFPIWGSFLFVLLATFKIGLYLLGLLWILKEWRKWKFLDRIVLNIGQLKREIIRGVVWSLFLLIFYLLVWKIFAITNFGGARALDIRIVFSRGYLVQLAFQLFRYVQKNRQFLKSAWHVYIFKPILPYNLAILRVLFFSYLIFIYFAKFITVLPIVGLVKRESLPFIGWLVHSIPISPSLYSVMIYVGMVSAVAVVFGWKTKFFAALNAITIFYVLATPNFFGKLWHEQLVIWLSWIMALSPISHVWSLDAVFNKRQLLKSPHYSWPIKVIWLHFGLIYFWAGFYKIWDAGFDWALSRSMINQVQLEWIQHYDLIPDIRIDLYPYMLHIGGILVICFELFFPLFIWTKNWRWIAFTGGLVMHNLLGYFMYISFFHFLQVFYVFLIDFNWFFRNKKVEEQSIYTSDWKVKTAILILILNLIAGMFNINSYPFSAYPKYSALIPDNIAFIRFNGDDSGYNCTEIAKNHHFRWEDYGWLEYDIIQQHDQGKKVNIKVESYWKIWQSKVPTLKQCDYVVVELCQRPVAPIGKDQIKVIDTLAILQY
jgi:hypothetical protein